MCLLLVLFRLTNMESIYIHLDEQSRESPGKESRKSFFPPPWTDAQKMSAGFPEKFPENIYRNLMLAQIPVGSLIRKAIYL